MDKGKYHINPLTLSHLNYPLTLNPSPFFLLIPTCKKPLHEQIKHKSLLLSELVENPIACIGQLCRKLYSSLTIFPQRQNKYQFIAITIQTTYEKPVLCCFGCLDHKLLRDSINVPMESNAIEMKHCQWVK